MPDLMSNPSNPKRTDTTDRFKTIELTLDSELKFTQFLAGEIKEFVAEFPPIRENTNPQAELRNNGINIQRPLNTRNLQPGQIELLKKIQAKSSVQLIAEGKLKTLIEKSVIKGYTKKENLDRIISEFSKLYGFSLETQDYFKEIIETYSRNKPVKEDFFASRNNDQQVIFKNLFGIDMSYFGVGPGGEPLIKIYEGPIGAELFCSNEVLNKVLTYLNGEPSSAYGFAGVSKVNIRGLNFPIHYNFNTKDSPETYFHELQHNWNSLFKHLNQFHEEITKDDCLQDIYSKQFIKADYTDVLEKYFKSMIHRYLLRFGDECLSMIKSNDSFSYFFRQDPGNSYDYLRYFRDSNSNSLDLYQDHYYIIRKDGFGAIQEHDQPVDFTNPFFKDNFKSVTLDATVLKNIRNNLYSSYYIPLIKEITDKITQILNKNVELKPKLIGTLSLYSDVALWPQILDKLISEL